MVFPGWPPDSQDGTQQQMRGHTELVQAAGKDPLLPRPRVEEGEGHTSAVRHGKKFPLVS